MVESFWMLEEASVQSQNQLAQIYQLANDLPEAYSLGTQSDLPAYQATITKPLNQQISETDVILACLTQFQPDTFIELRILQLYFWLLEQLLKQTDYSLYLHYQRGLQGPNSVKLTGMLMSMQRLGNLETTHLYDQQLAYTPTDYGQARGTQRFAELPPVTQAQINQLAQIAESYEFKIFNHLVRGRYPESYLTAEEQ